MTIAKTTEPVDLSKLTPDPAELIVKASPDRLLARMGGVVALMFRSVPIATRHREFRIAGAGWEHRQFRSHVTLAVDQGQNIAGLEPFAGELIFGGEVWT